MAAGGLLEGFGDEVLQCVGTLAAGCVLLWLLVKYVKSRPSNLHPDSVDQVAAVRRGRRGTGASTSSDDESPDRRSRNDRCPVCLDPHMQHGVVTNCGHSFCAHCILQYWRLDQWPGAARCPVCRRQVSLLLQSAHDGSTFPDNVQNEIQDYNGRMAGEWRPVHHYLFDVPVLLRHLWEELWSIRGPRLFWRLYLGYIVAAMVLYLLSPLDILPESIFGVLGFIDDIMFILLTFLYIAHLYRTLHIQR